MEEGEKMKFEDFARAHNVEIFNLDPSERIIRCGTVDKPKSKNGAYFWDGKKGWVFNWAKDAKVNWFESDVVWTPQEKSEWMAKRQSAQSEQSKRHAMVAEKAESTLRSAKLENHPYLEFKGFPDAKGLVVGEKLLIPMRNVVTNRVCGYQEIFWNPEIRKHEKKMLAGMRAKNAILTLGNRSVSEFWLVEGYATGLSVKKALESCGLDSAVVVCFSANNLADVADQIQGKRFIFSDNDVSLVGQKTAESTGLPWTMADKVGFDANDLHVKDSLFALVGKIIALRKDN